MQQTGLRSLSVVILKVIVLLFGNFVKVISSLSIFAHFLLNVRNDGPPVIFPINVQNVNTGRHRNSNSVPWA